MEGQGDRLETFTIVTTDPSEWMSKYHDRLAVILAPNDYQRWLELGESSHLPTDLLRPNPEDQLKAWRVSNEVGNVRNNRPELVEPLVGSLDLPHFRCRFTLPLRYPKAAPWL
jgi:putative SOS response-associated peptidase YedK